MQRSSRQGSQAGRRLEERQAGGWWWAAHCRRARQNVAHALSATSGNRNQYHVAAHSPPSPLPPLTHSHFSLSLPAPLSSLSSLPSPLPLFPSSLPANIARCTLATPSSHLTGGSPPASPQFRPMSTICRVIGQEVTPPPHLPYTRVPPVLFGLPETGYHLWAYSESATLSGSD